MSLNLQHPVVLMLAENAELERAARNVDCACGRQKAGHSKQRVVPHTTEICEVVPKDPEEKRMRIGMCQFSATCKMECQVCKGIHPFTANRLVDPLVLESYQG
jgi:hypothetical protein